MNKPTVRPAIKALIVTTYVAMIGVNTLANALPINGRTTGGVSDTYDNLFAPTGLTFAIWGVIYFLLGAHVLYQLGLFRAPATEAAKAAGRTGASATDRVALLERVGVLFSLSSLANTTWVLAWHYDFIGVSALLLISMLVQLILITRTIIDARLSGREWLFMRLPFSVYFGWITVATIANITVWLVSIGWDGFGIPESTLAAVIVAVGATISTAVILRDKDIPYALVLVWAFSGIWLKHTSPSGFDGAHPVVIATTLAAIAVFVVAAGIVLVRGSAARPASGTARHQLRPE